MSDRDHPNDSKLVDLSGVRAASPDASLARIERYWNDVRGHRLVPMRAEIDPRGLTGALAHAFVLERISTGIARFRIAGSHLTGLMGLEVRGMPLSAIFVPEARQVLSASVAAAFDDPSIIRLSLEADAGFGKPAMSGDMILLPLRSDLGEISRILGAVALQGQPGRTPRRLKVTGEARSGLTGVGGPEANVSREFEEPLDADRPGGRAVQVSDIARERRHHLRLVVDNEA